MKRISRRKFIVDSGVLATMLQTAGLLEGFAPSQSPGKKISKGLEFTGENGQNIVLYFINLQFRHGHLIPKTAGGAYLIAQIPPQSLHEKYFIQANPNDSPAAQEAAKLSTLSFLAFKLWPGGSKKKLRYSPEGLLDWSDQEIFKLMTTGEIAGNFPSFSKPEDVNNVVFPEKLPGDILDLNFYLGIVNKIITNSLEPYLSLIELPQGLILAPHTVKGSNTQVGLAQNTYRLSHAEHTHFINKEKVNRVVRERWNLQINYTSTSTKDQTSRMDVPPALRALAIFSGNAIQPNKNLGDCAVLPIDPAGNQPGYLPAFLDEVELVYLNQMTNTVANFDITVDKDVPLLLTGSGATVKFTYENYQIPTDPKYNFISLVGYEHHFQDGRDNFIKISRIGVIAPTSQKTLHVKIAERTILNGESFLLYYEYVELIDPHKMFPPITSTTPSGNYQTFGGAAHFDRNINFSAIKAGFVVSPRMLSAQADGSHFWVYNEFGQETNSNLMMLPFNYVDQNGKVVAKASDHAIYFMRRDFFCDVNEMNRLLVSDTSMNPAGPALMVQYDDGQRMRIPFNNQVVGFTPDDPMAQNPDGTPNKINQMETEFADYKFSVATPVPGGNVFDTATYPIYPQITRAKVYIDHIQQYSPQKLASLVEYHLDYLNNGLTSSIDNLGNVVGNQAKLIVQHTQGFMNGAIQKIDGATAQLGVDYAQLNQTYSQIADLFNAAGDKTGAMINSSIKIERFALAKQALTLPDKVNTQWAQFQNVKDRVLQTIDIFNGSSPQILNGIDLKSILQDVLGADVTPNFNLNKVTGAINDIDSYIEQLGNNPIIVQTVAKVREVNADVQKLSKAVTDAQANFNQAQQDLITAQNTLINSLPDINKLKNSLQLYLQTLKLNLFANLNAQAADVQQYVLQEVVMAVNESNLANNTIQDLLGTQDMTAIVGQVIAAVQNPDAQLTAGLTFLQTFLLGSGTASKAYKSLTSNTKKPADIYNNPDWLPGDISLNDYYGAAGLYTLHTQLTDLTAAAARGNDVTALLKTTQTQLDAVSQKINGSVYAGIQAYMDCYQVLLTYAPNSKLQLDSLLLFFKQYVKANIGYYVERYNQYQKDYNDIKATIQQFSTLFNDANALVQTVYDNRQALLQTYLNALLNPQPGAPPNSVQVAWGRLQTNDQALLAGVNTLLTSKAGQQILQSLGKQELLNAVTGAQGKYNNLRGQLAMQVTQYEDELRFQAEGMLDQLKDTFNGLLAGLDTGAIASATAEFQQALKFLSNPIQQQISYQWQTQNFKTADLGIVKFIPGTDPVTSLNVNVTGKISFDPLQLPQVAIKTETYAQNSLTNFSVSFLSVITVDFASISFVAGSSVSKNLSVKVRSVQFDGALSFIQALEDLLGDLGDGFGMTIMPNGVAISYNSPVFGFGAPGFTFDNISIGIKLVIYVDSSPMMLYASLATAECKATVAAGVYGGCFFCAVGLDPQRGMRSIEMAFEMGAYVGISLGPISGSVKFMVGLYFKKDDSGVTMEGYFIAEGTLSVWILSVSARLYMYVRSQNSTVTGGCTVSYSVKLGFISKSFSGSYSKTLAGAESNHTDGQKANAQNVVARMTTRPAIAAGVQVAAPTDDLEDLLYAIFKADEQRPLSGQEWNEFYQTFYK
jgi:hypothetical protein